MNQIDNSSEKYKFNFFKNIKEEKIKNKDSSSSDNFLVCILASCVFFIFAVYVLAGGNKDNYYDNQKHIISLLGKDSSVMKSYLSSISKNMTENKNEYKFYDSGNPDEKGANGVKIIVVNEKKNAKITWVSRGGGTWDMLEDIKEKNPDNVIITKKIHESNSDLKVVEIIVKDTSKLVIDK